MKHEKKIDPCARPEIHFICIYLHFASAPPKSEAVADRRQLPQPEGKSSQNQDLAEIWGYFGSDLAGLQLFYHCIDSGFQHRFSHLLVESYRFRMVLCEFRW